METENKLGEAISILYDMESNNYEMTNAIVYLNRKISSLGIKRNISRPKIRENNVSIFSVAVFGVGACAAVGAVLLAIYGLISGYDLFLKIIGIIGGLLEGALMGGICGIFVGAVAGWILKVKEKNIIEAEYSSALEKYKRALENEQQRLKEEFQLRKLLCAQRDMLKRRLTESEQKLCEYYEIVGIDNEYRNIIPIGYMNMYIRMGVSTKLEGTDGLNYLVWQELRQEQMQQTLDEISQKLDKILDNQSLLYKELVEINEQSKIIAKNTIAQLSNSIRSRELLENIENNTAVAAYNSERIEREVLFGNFMLAYRS